MIRTPARPPPVDTLPLTLTAQPEASIIAADLSFLR
jgi:hypothetical protein